MSQEIKERPVIWIYELCSHVTGEVRTVLSRKFIGEISKTKGWLYCACTGYFDYQGVYNVF